MAYIGRNPAIGTQKVLDSLESQFNGTLTTFDLRYNTNTIYPTISSALIVSLGGVLQEPGSAYNVASDQITFATAPLAGTDCWILLYSEFGGQAGATPNLTVGNNLAVQGATDLDGDIDIDAGQVTYTASSNIAKFADNAKLIFGNGDDLQIYHTADTESVIYDNGTGPLKIRTNKLQIKNAADSSTIAEFKSSTNGVELYFDNSKKFETTSTGATVTGTALATALSTGASGTGINISTNTITGPATLTLDPAGVGDNTGTVIIAGDLQVDGTTTTINSTTLTVDDKNIVLASGAANAAAADGAGITIDTANATLLYKATPDAWSFNKSVGIGTDNPNTLLNLFGTGNTTINVHNNSATAGTYSRLQLITGGSGSSAKSEIRSLRMATATAATNLAFFTTVAGATSPTERLRIETDGNIKVTSATQYKGFHLVKADGGTVAQLVGHASDNDEGGLNLWDGGTKKVQILSNGPSYLMGGNVGIGTNNPGTKLHVNSTLTEVLVDATAGDSVLNLRNAGNTNWSGINFTRERSTGTNVTGGSIWMPSVTANNSALLYIQTQSASAGAGIDGTLADNNGVRLKLASQPNGVSADSAFSVEMGSSERFRIDADGNVGIGTDNPAEKLDVRGNLVVGGSASSNYIAFQGTTGDMPSLTRGFHSYIGERIYGGTEDSELLILKDNDYAESSGPDRVRIVGANIRFDTYDANNTHADFEAAATDSNNSLALLIDTDGKVGIGTDNPQQILDIASTAPNIRFTDTVDGYSEIDGNAASLKFNADKGNAKADSKITFFVDNTEKVRITSGFGGNLLVGMDTVTNVNATAHFKNGINIVHEDQGGTNEIANATAAGQPIGRILFTDARPGRYAEIECGVDGTPGTNDYPGRLVFRTTPDGGSNTVERMRIDSDGNVGINATSPSHKLHVVGDVRAQGGALILNYADADNIDHLWHDDTSEYGTPGSFVFNSDTTYQNSTGGTWSNIKVGHVYVDNGNLGTTVGNIQDLARFYANNGNATSIRIQAKRKVAGNNWQSAGYKIFCHTDATEQGYIEFNPHTTTANDGSYDVAIGSGSDEIIRFKDGGNVGIGTTNPTSKLVVYGAGSGDGTFSTAEVVIGKHTGPKLQATQEGADNDRQGLALFVHPSQTNSDAPVEHARFHNTGKLFVMKGSYGMANAISKSNYNSHTEAGEFRTTSANGPALTVGSHGSANTAGAYSGLALAMEYPKIGLFAVSEGTSYGKSDLVICIQGDSNTSPATLSHEKLRVKKDGNVGIGTDNPGAKLHVYGAGTQLHLHNTTSIGKTTNASASTGQSQAPPSPTIKWANPTPQATTGGRGYQAWVQSGDAYPNSSTYFQLLIKNSGFYRVTVKRSHSSTDASVAIMTIYGLANSTGTNKPVVHISGASGSGSGTSTVQSGHGYGSSNAVASFYWTQHAYNINTHDTIIRIYTNGSNNQGILALVEKI